MHCLHRAAWRRLTGGLRGPQAHLELSRAEQMLGAFPSLYSPAYL